MVLSPEATAFGEKFESIGRKPARVSLVFPAYNRLEFTKQAWAALMANTDWSLVSEFHVYDDGSTDGTREFLMGACSGNQVPGGAAVSFHCTELRSPMGLTIDWIRRSRAPILAKLDNDTIYPPEWLNIALDVMDRNPDLDMLGLECMREPAAFDPSVPKGQLSVGEFGILPAKYVSGLGLYRASAFHSSLPVDGGYFGFEEWMQGRKIKCGWILPSLPTFLLDRLPIKPWRALSESYVRKGWQRAWSGAGPLRYKPEQHAMWDWWRPVE